MSTFHTPVLVKEVIEGLGVIEGGKYIDATVGGGGHGMEIVKLGGNLLGIDLDPEAVEFAKQNIKYQISNFKLKDREWKFVQGNFRNIEPIAKENGFYEADGILFDLGVSSYQLDTPGRGFSYRFADAPLDMRMSAETSVTAADIVNTYSEEELYEIIARYGEEQLAGTIAHALVGTRRVKDLTTVGDLVGIIRKLIRNEAMLNATLSRVFQALRIAVNDELGALKEGLAGAGILLRPGGRIAVISFHSLEDRLVKRTMSQGTWENITKRPIEARHEEIQMNPRSRSAKLRIAIKV